MTFNFTVSVDIKRIGGRVNSDYPELTSLERILRNGLIPSESWK